MTAENLTGPKKCLRGYKFRLAPNNWQQEGLQQHAGAARATYNMMVGYNADAQRRRRDLHDQIVEKGTSSDKAWEQVKTRATQESSLQLITSYTKFATEILTPEIERHRQAAQSLAEGKDRDHIWDDSERYENPWMHAVPRRVLVSGLQDASKAFGNYFDSQTGKRAGQRVRFPRFKKKDKTRDSYTIPRPEAMGPAGAERGIYHRSVDGRGGSIDDYHHVRLAGLGVLRVNASTKRLSRVLRRGGEIRSFTVSKAASYWYVAFLVAEPDRPRTVPNRRQRTGGSIGVDLGVSRLMTLDDGTVIANPRLLSHNEKRIARTQRKIARATPGSANHDRLKRRLAKQQHHLAQHRQGLLHEITTELVHNATLIAIEDLNVVGMTASARGTIEAPGRKVRAKAGLNRAILDVSFGTIRTQLGYKCADKGVTLAIIDRYFPSSQTCSQCRSKTKIPLSVRTYTCRSCGLILDRDHNAARNIVNYALAAAGEELKHGRPGTGTTLNGRGASVESDPSAMTEVDPGGAEAARLVGSPTEATEPSSRVTDCPSPTQVKQGTPS
ncbi:RNA-guided endonuclease InsQ/TnpB family protein [Candidatus Corynebacterium faecigallinarum]|uniref:RNA-guided endonuclease InsQ/TnpB family protein n=1 Tax=Candidatus Corynebacterium faecigallinarum TaxID=2838528 RepID=UPI003FD61C50